MTDIDFDELDRAVNSLMNKRQTNSGSASESATSDADQAVETTNTDEQSAAPAVKSPVVSRPVSTRPQPSPMISSHSSGRFMDVVHPSSQMVSGRKMASAPSRTGESVVSTTEKDETDAPADVIKAPTATEAEDQAIGGKETLLNNEFTINEGAENTTTIDKASPFITNATIQKRPLNPLNEVVEEAPVVPPSMNENDVEAILNSTSSDGEAIAAAEITEENNLMASESPTATEKIPPAEEDLAPTEDVPATEKIAEIDDPGTQIVDKEATAPEFDKELMSVEEIDVEDIEEEPLPAEEAKDAPVSAEVDPITKPVAGDIAQQYAVEDIAVAELEPEPMYDTAAKTSSELNHQEKKKGGWLTILLILLFLAIGIGGGAAAYYLLIQ